MGIFDRFKKHESPVPERYSEALAFESKMDGLLSADRYIARRDYKEIRDESEKAHSFFCDMKANGTFDYYCKKNRLKRDAAEKFLRDWEDLEDLKAGSRRVKEHNEAFYARHLEEEREYLDHVLDGIDPNIDLDEGQRRVVLCDEDYTLVIAGAGAGKTTAVAAKVKYLVDKMGVDPKDILVVSFSNNSVNELKERIQKKLKIACPVTTFHSAGNAILRKNDTERTNVKTEGFLYRSVSDYVTGAVLTNPEIMKKLLLFFSSYFDAPYEGDDRDAFFRYIAGADFSTLKTNLNEYNRKTMDRLSRRKTTAGNEILRSFEEVKIANWLYLHSIDYEYEPVYPYHIFDAKKPYTPDFRIVQGDKVAYIEHFGITEDGRNSRYTEEELERYKQNARDKIKIHRAHGTDLICTYSSYRDGASLESHLQSELEKRGFEIEERDSEEVFKKLVAIEENKYVARFCDLVTTFVNLFKTDGYGSDDFDRLKKGANERSKLFFDICKAIYLDYEKRLLEADAWDFSDMINESAKLLPDAPKEWGLDFRYIIVDEYQDISAQRFDLVKALSEHSDAKITAVGDDWQSIYSFSGADISLFTHFCDIMGYGEVMKITKTYRNPQEVIDIAGNFIQKNAFQISKKLESDKTVSKPLVMWVYDDEYKRYIKPGEKRPTNFGKALDDLIDRIIRMDKREKRGVPTIALVGRYNFDGYRIGTYSEFSFNETTQEVKCLRHPEAKITFITAHSSKGLGFDEVVIINAKDAVYGFPSKIEDEPLLKYVRKEDRSYEYAEERRLFYVAMTRTKNRVFMIVPKNRPSDFVREIVTDKRDDPLSVTLIGDCRDKSVLMARPKDEGKDRYIKRCPVCGYPLLLRAGRNVAGGMWICSNEPEICTYMTNEINPYGLGVHKCDMCRDGYLVVKKSKAGEYFLGCTEYRADKTGCNRSVGAAEYRDWLGDERFTEEDFSEKPVYKREEDKKKEEGKK